MPKAPSRMMETSHRSHVEDDLKCHIFMIVFARFFLKMSQIPDQFLKLERHPPCCELYETGDPVGRRREMWV